MKFTRTIVEKVFESLDKTPESIREFNAGRDFDVYFMNDYSDSLRVVIYGSGCIEFTVALDYRGTFDASDVTFFDSINVTSWEIDKHWINFKVNITNEEELEDVTRKVIDRYFYY